MITIPLGLALTAFRFAESGRNWRFCRSHLQMKNPRIQKNLYEYEYVRMYKIRISLKVFN